MGIGRIKEGNFAKSDLKLGSLYPLTPCCIREKINFTASFLAKKRRGHEASWHEIAELEFEVADGPRIAGSLHDQSVYFFRRLPYEQHLDRYRCVPRDHDIVFGP